MRLGVISDIHGHLPALRVALDCLGSDVDEILCAGDAFSDHRFSNEVVEVLRASRARYVLGNHELALLGPAGCRAREAPHVKTANLEYVRSQETVLKTSVRGATVLMVHGSPWEPNNEYLSPDSERFARTEDLDTDILILGHTHVPYVARHHGTLVVNPGSVGRPERPGIPDLASCAIVDTDAGFADIIDFPLPGR